MRSCCLASLAVALAIAAAGPCFAQALPAAPPSTAHDPTTMDNVLQPDQSAPANMIRFSGSNRTGVADCTARNTQLRGNSNEVTFRGGCHSLTIAGSKNDVTVEIAAGALISVRGNNNVVHWHVTGGTKQPRLRQSGHNNTLNTQA